MHDVDFGHEHAGLSEEDKAAIARFIWSQETVELRTIGIDIGSSTSHLLFAKVTLQRQSQGLSSRFLVIDREIVWRSPIMLTPFLPDGTIEAAALGRFIHESCRAAGIARSDVDSGAVILTGEAIKRRMPARSTSCSPKRPASSSAPRRDTSSNARSPRMARAPSRCRASAANACCMSIWAAARRSSP